MTTEVFHELLEKYSTSKKCPLLELKSGHLLLDDIFGSYLKGQKIIELGIPLGAHGRLIPLSFLLSNTLPLVWVYSHHRLSIYPPSWVALRMDLARIFFIRAKEPVRELRPLFSSSLFSLMVLDSPQKLSSADMAFLAQETRRQNRLLFIIRPFYLSPKRGNPHAHLRANISLSDSGDFFSLNILKGKKSGFFKLPLRELPILAESFASEIPVSSCR